MLRKLTQKLSQRQNLLILSAFVLIGFQGNTSESLQIKRATAERTETIFSVQQTRTSTNITSYEKEWNDSVRRLIYDADMKDGTFTTIETLNEYYILNASQEQTTNVRVIFGSGKPIKGFNEVVKLKAEFSKPHETRFYKIDQKGFVHFPSENSGNDPDRANNMTATDMGLTDNLLLNLPVNLHKIGDEQEFIFRCLDHLWMLGPKDVYKKYGKAKLADIKNDNHGHNIVVVRYDFSETVSTESSHDQKGKVINLYKDCSIQSVGNFDLTTGEWLNIQGTKKESQKYGTEGSETIIEFEIVKKDKMPTDYLTSEQLMKEIKSLMEKEKEIVFEDFFESGEGAHLIVNNCEKNAPDYNEKKCYKNREMKMFLFEEQKEINRVLSQIDVKNCACKKPENFENFESDRLPKWQYLVCLKECEARQ